MRALILSAGKATRLDGATKALVEVRGRTVLDRQMELLAPVPAQVVVSRAHDEITACPQRLVPRVHRGPIGALAWSVNPDWTGPILVVYGDTLWSGRLPMGAGDWIGVAAPVNLQRRWDVPQRTRIAYRPARPGEQVCVGLYHFSDARRLRTAIDVSMTEVRKGEVGMADLYARYSPGRVPHRVRINGWEDVGDTRSLAIANQGAPA